MAVQLAAARQGLQNLASAAWNKVPALPVGIREKRDAVLGSVYGTVSQISCEGILSAQFSNLAGQKLLQAKDSSEAAEVGNGVGSRAVIEFTKRVVSAYRIAIGALSELSEGFSRVFSSTGKVAVNLLSLRVKDAGFELKGAAKALGHTAFFTVASVVVGVAGLIFPGKAYKAVNPEQNVVQRDAVAIVHQRDATIAQLKEDLAALELEAKRVPELEAQVEKVAELEAQVTSLQEELAAAIAEKEGIPTIVENEEQSSNVTTPAGSEADESSDGSDKEEELDVPAAGKDSIARRVSERHRKADN